MTIFPRIPLWLDCDPGHDDTFAILLSAFHPGINLVGISTVFGNSTLEHTTYNALSILTGVNRKDIPVYKGNEFPLEYPRKIPVTAPGIHGENGLGGHKLPSPLNKAKNETIDQFYEKLADEIKEYDGELSIAAVGPLTNIAKFFKLYPELRSEVKYISIMGGGIDIYNFKGHGEFNIWNDPHAANLIFNDPILKHKVILSPLNVTHTLILTKPIQEKIYNKNQYKNDPFRKFLYDLMLFFADSYQQNQNFPNGPPVHDPIAVYVLLMKYGIVEDPELEEKHLKLTVDKTIDGEREGEILHKETGQVGTTVVFNVKVSQFWDIVLSVIETADQHLKACHSNEIEI